MSASIEKELTIKVSRVSIVINILLTLMKLLARGCGSFGRYGGRCGHSASDVFGSFLVIIGANVSGKAADQNIPMAMTAWNVSSPLCWLTFCCWWVWGLAQRSGKSDCRRLQPVGCARPLGADCCGYLHCGKRRIVLVHADCC